MSYQLKQNKYRPSSILLHKQKGMVIVVALFIMALVATMAYVMMSRLSRDTHRTMLIQNAKEAEGYVDGSVLWAKAVLKQDWQKQQVNRLVDRLPIESPVDHQDGFDIQTEITDLQGQYNLNNLTLSGSAPLYFKQLLRLANPSVSDNDIILILVATRHWMSQGTKNELDKYYEELPHPYQAAHQPFATVSEWKNVRGVTDAIYAATAPYLTALPEKTKLNVNTMSAINIAALSSLIQLNEANDVVLRRARQPFTRIADFLALPLFSAAHLTQDDLTPYSQYFLVKSTVKKGNQTVVIYSLLQRNINGSKTDVMVLRQTKGVW